LSEPLAVFKVSDFDNPSLVISKLISEGLYPFASAFNVYTPGTSSIVPLAFVIFSTKTPLPVFKTSASTSDSALPSSALIS